MDSSALSLSFLGFANLVSWIQRTQERVQKEYDDAEWHPLDRIVWWHKYDMRDLSEWPFDAVQVYADANTFYALGSLKAACSLDIFLDRFGQAVDVVVSCCAKELRAMPGGPSDWQVYFQSKGVKSLQFAMRDVPARSADDAESFYREARHTADAWFAVAAQLMVCREQATAAGKPFRVLFHCFGGINRSTGTLAAWLIIGHGLTAEAAVSAILAARPSLRPWWQREYVLWLLASLEMQLENVRVRVQEFSKTTCVDSRKCWSPSS